MKGLFIPMILLIHAFQMLGGSGAVVPAYQLTYIIATMTGAAIFIFVLGIGSVYSGKSNKALAISGLKLIVLEFVWNALALALPMVIGQLLRMSTGNKPAWADTLARIPMMLEYINIFFIAGVCYLVLAVLRKTKLSASGYIVLALVLFAINPFLYMNEKTTGNGMADYILTTFVGGRASVSLNFITLLPHALLGVGFGKVLRRVENKGRLYGVLCIPLLLIIAVYFIYALTTYRGLNALYDYSRQGYIYPDILRALANAASVILLAAMFYALRNIISRCKPIHTAILHFNSNTTPYYAIHPFFFSCILAAAAYIPFSAAFCTAMTVVVWGMCFVTIFLWKGILKKKR